MFSSKSPPEHKTMNTVVVKWGIMDGFIGGVSLQNCQVRLRELM
jgi:hypothetical protein